ncbi:MAG TPA: hypothetical protein DIC19_04925 [Erysipelotrichaceae bacterium]|nr:hypothetical protein [Erysipelotrichaceae bacterium]
MEQHIETYIKECPLEVQARLIEVHTLIEAIAKDATQCISWGMPTFKMGENLVHYAHNKHHLGLYPGSEAIVFFEDRLNDYKHSKGAIQFPYAKELPVQLIQDIVHYRVESVTANKKAR